MLYSFDTGQYITYVPHEKDFKTWRDRLDPKEIREIKNALKEKIADAEIHTSSWMPGANWTDTPFQSIYEKACRQNETQAAMCFGLFLWQVLMEDDDVWGFGRYEKDGMPIRGMTYFKVENPPRQ